MTLTFHDIDERADITFLDDEASGIVLDWIHTVHDLLDLRCLQVLKEIIVRDSLGDQFSCTENIIEISERPTVLY